MKQASFSVDPDTIVPGGRFEYSEGYAAAVTNGGRRGTVTLLGLVDVDSYEVAKAPTYGYIKHWVAI